jgi:hypothetical protein
MAKPIGENRPIDSLRTCFELWFFCSVKKLGSKFLVVRSNIGVAVMTALMQLPHTRLAVQSSRGQLPSTAPASAHDAEEVAAKKANNQRGSSSWHGFSPLQKTFVVFGLAIGILLTAIFALDIAVGFPFQQASLLFDAGMITGGIILIYLSGGLLRNS